MSACSSAQRAKRFKTATSFSEPIIGGFPASFYSGKVPYCSDNLISG
jgi:hypothetical protein